MEKLSALFIDQMMGHTDIQVYHLLSYPNKKHNDLLAQHDMMDSHRQKQYSYVFRV